MDKDRHPDGHLGSWIATQQQQITQDRPPQLAICIPHPHPHPSLMALFAMASFLCESPRNLRARGMSSILVEVVTPATAARRAPAGGDHAFCDAPTATVPTPPPGG